MIGMGIAYEWHNQKTGSFLIESALQWAIKNGVLQLIWLEVYSTNIPGLRLYEKFGFEKAGLIKIL